MKICIFVLPKNKVRSFVNMDFEMNILTETLLDWYADNKRDLPWRDTADPYRIWISEIILQQTRVVQGYEYFLRFIRRFPDVETLAAASEDEVLKYWQGLGYYSRARNLHAAAKSMNGKFPASYQEVRALKGVGDYTAAAICSIAYNMPYAVVDGNVYRVLSRYWGVDTPIDSTEGKRLFAVLADEMLDKSRPAIYNQAIMDFGAVQTLVCMGIDNRKLVESFTGIIPEIISTDSLDAAMQAARKASRPGDVVLLSPACASFDLFKNYENRGELFKQWVAEHAK